MSAPILLVMAGGTGGHIMPGLAAADAMRARGWSVAWMGNPGGMEARLVPGRGYKLLPLKFGAVRGKGLIKKLLLPFLLLAGFASALGHLRRLKPSVVIGMGGYVTFPGGMMAALLGRPFVVHEQNAVAGLANRVLSKLADQVLCGFPQAIAGSVWTGNPVRPEIVDLAPPAVRLRGRSGPLRILVIGGSLGAVALNTVVPKALALIDVAARPQVVHQAGERHLEALRAAFAAADVQADCVPFIDDMASAYANADLVICRAGALTVAEVAAAGVAALFVPYPHAVDDHQTSNAPFLAAAGAAMLVAQADLNAEELASRLQALTRDELLVIAERARALARSDATQRVADVCVALGGRNETQG